MVHQQETAKYGGLLRKISEIRRNTASLDEIAGQRCYITIMTRLITLSLSLVAFAGGAGLGLSAIHHYAMSDETAMLVAPETGTGIDTGFVVPSHVPAISEAAVIVPTLPEPQITVDPIIVPQPVVTETAPEALAPALNARPAPRASIATATAPAAPEWSSSRTRAKTPIDFTQSRASFVAGFSEVAQPDYVVGVYR